MLFVCGQALHIFLEYVPGGSIASLLQKFGCFSEKVIRIYTRQARPGPVVLRISISLLFYFFTLPATSRPTEITASC